MKRLLAAWCIGIAAAGIAVPAALILPQPACADQWVPPHALVTLSPGGKCRLTVTPEIPGDPRGPSPGGTHRAHALLEQRARNGSWQTVWQRDLINTPRDSYISGSGRYVATLDNWYDSGAGDDAVAIYDTRLGTIRHFSLLTLLGKRYLQGLLSPATFIQWRSFGRRHARVGGEALIVPVLTPDVQGTVEFAIDLAHGTAAPLDSFAWRKAQKEAEPILADIRAARRADYDAQRSPLRAPTTAEERDWEPYLAEAYFRLVPDSQYRYPKVSFLPRASAPDYPASLAWLVGLLRERGDWPQVIASPDSGNLADLLVAEAGQFAPGALRETHLYIAIGPDLWPRIRAAFAQTGARLVRIDTRTSIPQRPDRMPDPRQLLDD